MENEHFLMTKCANALIDTDIMQKILVIYMLLPHNFSEVDKGSKSKNQ